MGKVRVRLSGDDIQFINNLRGSEEPVYETVNGRKHYRPLLSESEREALKEYRISKVKEQVGLVNALLTEDQTFQEMSKDYTISLVVKHRKKGYTLSTPVL